MGVEGRPTARQGHQGSGVENRERLLLRDRVALAIQRFVVGALTGPAKARAKYTAREEESVIKARQVGDRVGGEGEPEGGNNTPRRILTVTRASAGRRGLCGPVVD